MRWLVVRAEVKCGNKEDTARCDQLAGAAIFLFVITSQHQGWVWPAGGKGGHSLQS